MTGGDAGMGGAVRSTHRDLQSGAGAVGNPFGSPGGSAARQGARRGRRSASEKQPAIGLASWRLHDPDDVSLGVGEERDGGLGSDLGQRHDHAPTGLLDPLQMQVGALPVQHFPVVVAV